MLYKVFIIPLFVAAFGIQIYAQCANENFIAPRRFRVGELLVKNAAGDFNCDGKMDIAVLDAYSNKVSIMFGDGAGNLGEPTDYNVGINPQEVVVGDFNGDGNLDLITVNAGDGSLSILSGDGSGAFSSIALLSFLGNSPSAIAVDDFNGDGKTDIVTSNFGSASVSLLVNNCGAKKIQKVNLDNELTVFPK